LITYGGSLHKVLAAAQELTNQSIDAGVIDLRSLRPLDIDTITASVKKTHRVLIVDEGWHSGSLAAEIGMRLAEESVFELDAPLARVCSQEVPILYARHTDDIVAFSSWRTISAPVGWISMAIARRSIRRIWNTWRRVE
jgi:pyruvate/2-oxoglutarate/acetoin dehydrogenase E1 component